MAESAPPGIDRWPAADETRPINDHGDHWRVGADQAQDALELGRPVQILSRPPDQPGAEPRRGSGRSIRYRRV